MKWRRQPRAALTAPADQLTVPKPFDLAEFRRHLAERRGRPLRLVPPSSAEDAELPCGRWLGLDTADLVLYQAGAAPVLRARTVLHEVSHMLLGHRSPESGQAALGDDEAARLFELTSAAPADDRAVDRELGLATDRVLSLLARDGCSSRQETEAESPATPILERATRTETGTSPDSAEVPGGLNDALGHPVRGI